MNRRPDSFGERLGLWLKATQGARWGAIIAGALIMLEMSLFSWNALLVAGGLCAIVEGLALLIAPAETSR